jgi:hypothetical protein
MTAALGIAAAAWLLSMERQDLAYFFSDREPISLGAEGDYHFDRLASNRYAQIHGTPTLRGAYAKEGGSVFVVLGLRDTPVLVRRPALPNEEWTPGKVPPQPDPRPFGVRGRLLSEQDAQKYRDGFEKLRGFGEVRPREGKLWILMEGERPGGDRGALLISAALVLFALLNLGFLIRSLVGLRSL